MAAASGIVDVSDGQPDNESDLELIKNTNNQQLAEYINRHVPFDDSCRHDLDQAVYRLSGHLNALLLYQNYSKVRRP